MTKYSAGPWELDSAKDGDGRYQIVHAKVPDGVNGDFGYPVCDTMNRHHCISPEEDEANGKLLTQAYAMADLLLRAYTHVSHGGPTRGELESVLRAAGVIG